MAKNSQGELDTKSVRSRGKMTKNQGMVCDPRKPEIDGEKTSEGEGYDCDTKIRVEGEEEKWC